MRFAFLASLYIDNLKPDVVLIASMGADKKRKILAQAKNEPDATETNWNIRVYTRVAPRCLVRDFKVNEREDNGT